MDPKTPISSDDAGMAMEEQVYRRVRAGLLAGDFLPGEKLSIRKVAAALQTSAMPARVALGRLVAEHALDVLPAGTAIVPRLTRKAFVDLTEMRLRLEPLALRLAAAYLTPADLDMLTGIAREQSAAKEDGNFRQALTLDRQFLFAIYERAQSNMLVSFIESMWLRRSPLFWEARWLLAGHEGRASNQHERIAAMLLAQDVDAAVASLSDEIRGAADVLLEHVAFADDPSPPRGLRALSPLPRQAGA